MAKKTKEPEYILSSLNTPMLNYSTYYMNSQEKVINFLIAFFVGGIVGLAFYGGQFRDADGLKTSASFIFDVILFCVIGIGTSFVYFPIRRKQLKEKRKLELTKQFRSFLDSLAVSLSSGMNMSEALISTYNDLKVAYTENSYIVHEVMEMISGMQNNVPVENVIYFFGERSQIDDIKNFATVFNICYRAGGNMKDIVRKTNNIMSEKIEISEEIETAIASNKTQFTAMMFIPIVLMILLRTMSSSFAIGFATPAGVVAITVAIGIFIGAFKLGQKIMDVKG